MLIGATSAIASAVARLCAGRGDTLWLLARDRRRLESLVDELGPAVAGHEAGDFDDFAANPDRIERAIAGLGGVDVALIAHGDLGDQLASERDFETARAILDTNLLSVVSLVIPLANHLEEQGSGTLAVTSSVAADRGRPRNYTYAAAKAGVNVLFQGLRTRLHARGVAIRILKLGPTDTPMTRDHAKNPLFATPEAVARGILRALEGGRSEVYLPGYWRPIMWGVRWLPEGIFQRVPFLSGR